MRALIVEDEPIFRMDLSIRLKRLGFDTVEETAFATESIAIAGGSHFDMILMDIRLKDSMSGIEAATRIAEDQSTPIIIMSAYRVDEEEIRRAVPSFVRFVSKPVSDDDLSSAVGHITA
ncbi:MAG: response regulator [Alkalispirochaeta sp.]